VGCSDDELALFLYTCKRTGLDPLARQIYAIKRSNKMTIQTGIDGYRLIADRTGKLAGISDYVFDSEEGKFPPKATVTVKKLLPDGQIAEFTATARWGEYNAGTSTWQKMPFLMLGKCAEALALRKAFPADLSGVYTAEEMAQADNARDEASFTAEAERQKAGAVPAEGDWNYNKTTGLLICRLLSVNSRKKKDGNGEYLTVQVNGQVGGKKADVLTYFHVSGRHVLLASVGKIAKFETEVKGDFANIVTVLEVDGVGVARVDDPGDETKARLLASTLGFSEKELQEMLTRYANSSWTETLGKLQAEKVRRDEEELA
jgi:phage recombination protein Bet